MRIAAISAYEYQRVYGVNKTEPGARPNAAFPFREKDSLRDERYSAGRAGKKEPSKDLARRLLPERTTAEAREAADIVKAFMAIRSPEAGSADPKEGRVNDDYDSMVNRLKAERVRFKTEWKNLLDEALADEEPNPARWAPIADKLASTPVAALFDLPGAAPGLLFEYKI